MAAYIWRSFVTWTYVLGILAWTAFDSREPMMSLTMCAYGRCPMVVRSGNDRIHPNVVNVALLGVVAVIAAWFVPVLVQDLTKRGDQTCTR